MAIQFQPPPDWLVKSYLDRQNPVVEGINSMLPAMQSYIAAKDRKQTQQNAGTKSLIDLLQTDPTLANSPLGKRLMAQAGVQPSDFNTGTTAPTVPQSNDPFSAARAPSALGGVDNPDTVNPAGNDSPLIAHWNSQYPQVASASPAPSIDGYQPPSTPTSAPAQAPSMFPDLSQLSDEQLYGHGKLGKSELDKRREGLVMAKTRGEMAPKTPITRKALLDSGKQFDPMTQMLVDPPADSKKPQSGAQKAADRVFGAEYAKYVAGGGYADVVGQIQSLEGVLTDLESGKKNLTGPLLTAQPDWARKRTVPESMEAQQAVEQSVQRTLKQTLGGQFTEKEGMLFMQRGYDPVLPEKANATKLRRMVGQLKTMALAKQQAIDYYEENGSLDGYRGNLYVLRNGEMVQTSKDDFYKMMGAGDQSQSSGVPSVGGTFQGGKVLSVKRI